jgi:hypothetical protein
VLICLAVSAALLSSSMRAALGQRQRIRKAADAAQTDLLVLAGRDRALRRLQADPEYTGETWQLGAEEITGRAGAQIVISVLADATLATDSAVTSQSAGIVAEATEIEPAAPAVNDNPARADRRIKITARYPLDEWRAVQRSADYILSNFHSSTQEPNRD